MSLKTFGPVEDNVLQQMAMCEAAEDGAKTVLCGDSHLGYSMPIGGVVAYLDPLKVRWYGITGRYKKPPRNL